MVVLTTLSTNTLNFIKILQLYFDLPMPVLDFSSKKIELNQLGID